MHPLTGYCDRWSVKPGERIRFMVSSADDTPFHLDFVRHLCADPNPGGPGYAEVPMRSTLDGEHAGRSQRAWLGSFGLVDGLQLGKTDGLTIAATIWPTTPSKGRQGVLEVSAGPWRLALCIAARGGIVAEASAADGTTVRAEVAAPLLARRWYDVAARLDASGRLQVTQAPRERGKIDDANHTEAAGAAARPAGLARVRLAALEYPGGEAPASAFFNGKLERPTLWEGCLTLDGAVQRQRPPLPHGDARGLLACWDFSLDIPSNTARDIGQHGAHARLINLPTRAMTGANWTGDVHDWKVAPGQYGAIHFHDDDQGDLGWRESFALVVPADWPSGFYAAYLRNGNGEDYIPFFVRPARPSADVVFLVPTFTYQVYGDFVRPGRGAEIRERATAWGALTETPDMNPAFGLSTYNRHSDGSGVSITTMLRPMLDTRPRQISLMDPEPGASGTGRVCADSYYIAWLGRIGVAHDLITDHDLHAEGAACLRPYRVVIAGQHPEYYSQRMMEALEAYLGDGGRLMYLGGNGFYWRAEPSAASPHALEVRRAESGIRVWPTEPGESYHAFGGGYAGLWRRIGKPAHRLVGIGFSVQGRYLGFPYRFTEAIRDPRVAFMLDGLTVAPGDSFGDAGYMGGGAAGFELDSVDAHLGTPPHALVVAKGVVIHPDYGWVNEDMLVIRHPKAPEDWSCADMVFFETASGGAVFSVGSMTYAGSIPIKECNGIVGRLTTNVLRRFLDPTLFR
ncbi:MAG: N,N-dimethylformamidase [Proteobacteria bacterium]|nr:N,N-dimethylformamidase [Pseudomonadota bacterium]